MGFRSRTKANLEQTEVESLSLSACCEASHWLLLTGVIMLALLTLLLLFDLGVVFIEGILFD